uniref:HMG box domain-containing protein n=1 Tax=Plectus sambesii TaxID=2011161 RepID=A0A914UN73_9BILA
MDRSAAVDGPFMAAAPSANPQYSAAKMNSSSSSANNNNSKSIKPPKAPEKPLMPYMRYSRKVWDQVKAANKDSKLWEIGRIIGQMWRELPAEDKQEHINDYETEKEQYAESLKAYQNSPAYQQYLACKEKAAQAEQRQRDMEIVGTNGVLVGAKSKGGPFSDSQNLKVEQRLTIPQIDSDLDMFDTDAVSTRRLAALRYQRNQRLLHEVFN